MFRPRVIPVLLMKKGGLVKSVQFKKHRYIGDPINAVSIFNAKKADEIIILDIDASKENRLISLEFVHKVGDEASMAFGVGGGIRSLNDITQIIKHGAEKVILGTIACRNPEFVKAASKEFGSSTISVCIDVKRSIFGAYQVRYLNGSKKSIYCLEDYARVLEDLGVGELIIQSIDNEGTYCGYDITMIKAVTDHTKIPVVALGGARGCVDFRKAFTEGNASALAAGSFFVYQGQGRGVLISYPSNFLDDEVWQ